MRIMGKVISLTFQRADERLTETRWRTVAGGDYWAVLRPVCCAMYGRGVPRRWDSLNPSVLACLLAVRPCSGRVATPSLAVSFPYARGFCPDRAASSRWLPRPTTVDGNSSVLACLLAARPCSGRVATLSRRVSFPCSRVSALTGPPRRVGSRDPPQSTGIQASWPVFSPYAPALGVWRPCLGVCLSRVRGFLP